MIPSTFAMCLASQPRPHLNTSTSSIMSSIDIFRASWPVTTQLNSDFAAPTESESDAESHTRLLSSPPVYSAELQEGEQIVCCDRLPSYRQVVRLHHRRYFAWLPGLGRLRRSSVCDTPDNIELADMAVVYANYAERDEGSGRFVVSGRQLGLAFLFALMVGIAISKPI